MREKLIVSKVPNNSFVRFLRGFLKLGFLEMGKNTYSQNRSINTTKNQNTEYQSRSIASNIEHYFQFPTTEYEPWRLPLPSSSPFSWPLPTPPPSLLLGSARRQFTNRRQQPRMKRLTHTWAWNVNWLATLCPCRCQPPCRCQCLKLLLGMFFVHGHTYMNCSPLLTTTISHLIQLLFMTMILTFHVGLLSFLNFCSITPTNCQCLDRGYCCCSMCSGGSCNAPLERVRCVPSPYFLVGFPWYLQFDTFGWMINAFLGEEVFIIHSYIPVRTGRSLWFSLLNYPSYILSFCFNGACIESLITNNW